MTDVPDLDRFHREAVEQGRQQIIANRWAVFTDDELDAIYEGLGQIAHKDVDQLYSEAILEFHRRNIDPEALRS